MSFVTENLKILFRPIIKPRRFQAFCVGMPRSGTTSIGCIFQPYYRALHEPEWERLIPLIIDVHEGKINNAKLEYYVKKRDKRLWLEMDASHLNYWIIEHLVEHFPNAKFILTIRDPYSWIESSINGRLFRHSVKDPKRIRLQDIRYAPIDADDAKLEKPLTNLGLPTLNSFLRYWSRHNHKILNTIPTNQLLVIRTDRINDSFEKIAEFLDIPLHTLNPQQAHVHKARGKSDLLSQIDQNYLTNVISKNCQDLLDQYFK